MTTQKRWYLGRTKSKNSENVYLNGFSWQCGWYWSGGHVTSKCFSSHFDDMFLKSLGVNSHILGAQFVAPGRTEGVVNPVVIHNGACVWEDLQTFLDNAQYSAQAWWRIKDLFTQFYALRKAAEVFQYGGHCTNDGRTPGEINLEMAKTINAHIEKVVIPAIETAMENTIGSLTTSK